MSRMRNRRTISFNTCVLQILIATLIFALADLIIVSFKAYSHISTSGLVSLALSCLTLYSVIAVFFLFFSLILLLISFVMRRQLSNKALFITTLFGMPLFLMFHNKMEDLILGKYVSWSSPLFYVPTAISLFVLILAVTFIHFVLSRITESQFSKRFLFTYPKIIIFSLVVFFLITKGSMTGIKIPVVYSEDEQHAESQQQNLGVKISSPERAKSFLVIMIECLRYDNFTPENAPFLWQLAQDNIFFTRYYVAAPATRPSMTSFFTSLYPVQHKCYTFDLHKSTTGKEMLTKVSDSVVALPKLLQLQGYRTVMITSNMLAVDSAFCFEDVFHRFNALEPGQLRYPFFEPFFGFGFLRKNLVYTRMFKQIIFPPEHSPIYFEAPRLNQTVTKELLRTDERPFLMYIHYIEPHSPYYMHPHQPFQINVYLPSKREKLLEAYRSEIRSVDKAIAKLYDFLKENGFLSNTYILITSDHGEEFYDHGDWGHGKSLFPEVLHVPAILIMPSSMKRSQIVEDVVSNIDIAPTMADLLNIAKPKSWEGRTLLPLLLNANSSILDARNSGMGGYENSAFSQFDNGYTFLASEISDGWQMIMQNNINETQKIMLFNLAEDPGGKNNLAGQGTSEEAIMMGALEEKLERLKTDTAGYEGKREVIDEEHMDQLRALGYIN